MAGPGAAAAALLPAVLLALLAPWAGRGGAAAPTAPNGTLEAELERRWESLVARSLARLPVAAQPKEAAVQSGAGDYLLGIKRLRRLYCNVGIGFHLQVLPDGRIGGVHADTSDSECGGPGGKGRGPGAPAAPSHWHLLAGSESQGCLGSGPSGSGTQTLQAPGVAAGTGFAHPGGRVPPPRLRKPRLGAQNSSAFARGHRARGAAAGTRGGPGRTPRSGPGPGGHRSRLAPAVQDWARPPRARDRRRVRARARCTPGAPWVRPAPGILGNLYTHPHPRNGVPEVPRPTRGSGPGGAGQGSPARE